MPEKETAAKVIGEFANQCCHRCDGYEDDVADFASQQIGKILDCYFEEKKLMDFIMDVTLGYNPKMIKSRLPDAIIRHFPKGKK